MLKLDYMKYLDKVHGGWIGKCIGGAVGALQENNKGLMEYTVDNVFPAVIPPNDDLDLQILYLQEVLGKKGADISSGDLGDAFAKYNLCLANEYSIAIKNIELGIEPPLSGLFNNEFFKHSMGCPIRSELWGFICPGNPDTAVRFAEMDGCIDHAAESIYGEKFFSAMEANAFFENDIIKLIEGGLAYVPGDTELSRCINFVLAHYRKGTPWQETRERAVRRFGSCDASYSVINIGITILALLYGKGDFTETMLTAVNCGYDTDCTAATSGAVLGQILGAGNIPGFWLKKIGKDIKIGTVKIERSSNLISDLAKETCTAGLSLLRDGVISIGITGIPPEIKPSLPLPSQKNELDITIRYNGLPSIGYGEKSSVTVAIKNNTMEEQAGILYVKAPEAMLSNIREMAVRLPAMTEMEIVLDFEFKKGIAAVPQKNITVLEFTKDGKKIAEKSFGLSGAYRMKLIGPFFDNYDTKKFDEDPFKNVMQKYSDGRPDLFSMFNGYANIDRRYLDEDFSHLDEVEGEYVNFHRDVFEIDEKVKYKGPCCIYLVYDFTSPEAFEDVSVYIGNNDAYRVWLNGKLLIQGGESAMYMMYNNYIENVRLDKGKNRMVMKLLRSGKSFEFSSLLRNVKADLHWFVDLESVMDNKQ